MKWIIRNDPANDVFDTREQAIAAAWERTPPGKNRRKVDGILGDSSFDLTAHAQFQVTVQAFKQLGASAAAAAEGLRRMIESIDNVIPETIAGRATELRHDEYNITVTAARENPPRDA